MVPRADRGASLAMMERNVDPVNQLRQPGNQDGYPIPCTVRYLPPVVIAQWPCSLRQGRGSFLERTGLRGAGQSGGRFPPRIIVKHILPGVTNTVIVITTLQVGQLILAEATLSFIGAGIPAPTPAWGLMVSDARTYVRIAWWTAFIPGAAIFLVVMSLNFLGDWMRDRFDPRLRQI